MQPICPVIEGAMDCRFNRSEAKLGAQESYLREIQSQNRSRRPSR